MYKSSIDAETALLQLERELQEASRAHGTVEQEMNLHRRAILEMELKRNDLAGVLRKSRENIRRIESEMRIAKTEFWRLKGENL
jgi:hypothetical protein